MVIVSCSKSENSQLPLAEKSVYAPIGVEMATKQVSEHCYYVEGAAGIATDNEGFISNAGFVVTDAGVVVFDALGTPSLGAALVEEIAKVTDQPIKKVIVSHYHADHIYGLQVFEDLGAEILAPQGSYQYLESEPAAARLEERQFSLEPWVNENTRLVEPDKIISSTTRFELGGVVFKLNYQGKAHSDGDLAMLIEPDQVLFSGDLIFEGRVPFLGNADTGHWLQALQELETSGIQALIPGHGPATSDPVKTLALTSNYLAYVREVFSRAVEEFEPFAEAYEQANWDDYKNLPAFEEANRANAYQVFLSLEAESLQQ